MPEAMPPARSSAARSSSARSSTRRATAGPSRGAGAGPSRGASAAASRSAQSFQPRRVRSRAPLSRIRWDRASRVVMLAVLLLVAWLWIDGISSLLRTHHQAVAGLAQVHRLAAENHRLVAEQKSLGQLSTILTDARKLGMVKKGEQAFVVTH
jgi:cell division protein FtsB